LAEDGEEKMFFSLWRYTNNTYIVNFYKRKNRAELVALCFFSIGKAKRGVF
jgi:hypothetical protein